MNRIRTAIVINNRANGEESDFEEIRPDFCPACGHEVIDDEEYCQFCGEELGSLYRVKEKRDSLTTGYKKEKLYSKMFIVDDNGKGKYNYLGEALERKFGASTDQTGIVTELYRFMGQNVSDAMLKIWSDNSWTSDMILYKTWSVNGADLCLTAISEFLGDTYTMLYYRRSENQISEIDYNAYELNNEKMIQNSADVPVQVGGKLDFSNIDFSMYSDEELMELKTLLRVETESRGIGKTATVYPGRYEAGVDLPAGRYSVTTTEDEKLVFIEIFKDRKTMEEKGKSEAYYNIYPGQKAVITLTDGQIISINHDQVVLGTNVGIVFE